jgi:subtilisin family serine protease
VAGGVNAAVAWAVPGGDGSEVRVVDCEYGFNPNHEDLPDVAVVYNGDGVLSVRADHGTAVLAILGGRNDVSGVTGICHGASLQFASESGGHRLDCLDALLIRLHNQQLTAGDVILLEMQTENDFLPAEYNNDFRAAVLTLVGNDICVVAAAGNGGKRLDNIPVWDSQNSHDDSGAIMVGAGASVNTSKPHSHLGVSNFGTRVNCQAWGLDVVTAGYNGDLHDNGLNERYTQSFANTSSASAIVAGVVACLQGAHKAHFDTHILPLDIRDALANPDFGIPQANSFFDPAANFPIGPLPDLERLLIHFGLL